jgi:hypothetical protein
MLFSINKTFHSSRLVVELHILSPSRCYLRLLRWTVMLCHAVLHGMSPMETTSTLGHYEQFHQASESKS